MSLRAVTQDGCHFELRFGVAAERHQRAGQEQPELDPCGIRAQLGPTGRYDLGVISLPVQLRRGGENRIPVHGRFYYKRRASPQRP